jgi:hypothetical protein
MLGGFFFLDHAPPSSAFPACSPNLYNGPDEYSVTFEAHGTSIRTETVRRQDSKVKEKRCMRE